MPSTFPTRRFVSWSIKVSCANNTLRLWLLLAGIAVLLLAGIVVLLLAGIVVLSAGDIGVLLLAGIVVLRCC